MPGSANPLRQAGGACHGGRFNYVRPLSMYRNSFLVVSSFFCCFFLSYRSPVVQSPDGSIVTGWIRETHRLSPVRPTSYRALWPLSMPPIGQCWNQPKPPASGGLLRALAWLSHGCRTALTGETFCHWGCEVGLWISRYRAIRSDSGPAIRKSNHDP